MIVRDLFQLSWLISWLTTARHPSSLPVCPCRTTKGHERAIIRLVERLHDVTQLLINLLFFVGPHPEGYLHVHLYTSTEMLIA